MRRTLVHLTLAAASTLFLFAAPAHVDAQTPPDTMDMKPWTGAPSDGAASHLVGKYKSVRLTTDLDALSAKEQQMIPLLIDAARAMDDDLLAGGIRLRRECPPRALPDSSMRRYAEINYGPWDRLDGNTPFVAGVGAQAGGRELLSARHDEGGVRAGGRWVEARAPTALKSLYTIVRRDADGELQADSVLTSRSARRRRARPRACARRPRSPRTPGLERYLELRAEALLTDDYQRERPARGWT